MLQKLNKTIGIHFRTLKKITDKNIQHIILHEFH